LIERRIILISADDKRTSHLAFDTEAAAPKRAADRGNAIDIPHCKAGNECMNGNSSTAAIHK
jgi:hypothetical protein